MLLLMIVLVTLVPLCSGASPSSFIFHVNDTGISAVRFLEGEAQHLRVFNGDARPPIYYNEHLFFASGNDIMRIKFLSGGYRHQLAWDVAPNSDGFLAETYLRADAPVLNLGADYEQNLGHAFYFMSNNTLYSVTADSATPVSLSDATVWRTSDEFADAFSSSRVESGGVFFLTPRGVQHLYLNPTQAPVEMLLEGSFTQVLTRRGPFYDLVALDMANARIVLATRWPELANRTRTIVHPHQVGLPLSWEMTGTGWIDGGILFFLVRSQQGVVLAAELPLGGDVSQASVTLQTVSEYPPWEWKVGTNGMSRAEGSLLLAFLMLVCLL